MHDQSTVPTSAAARLLSKLERSADGCLLYVGARFSNGYGAFWLNGKTARAHRIAWIIANGPVPDGMRVLHHCDVRACCDVAHLFLGSDADNIHDMWAKGRKQVYSGSEHWMRKRPERVPRGDAHYLRRNPEKRRAGEQAPTAKLTWVAVREVRARVAAGERYGSIARAFGVSNATVGLIAQRKTWIE